MSSDPGSLLPFLRCVPLFAGLDDSAVVVLLRVSHLKQVTKGAILFNQDDCGEAAYIVRSGGINIILCTADGRELVINEMRAGDWNASGVPPEHSIADAPKSQMVVRCDTPVPGKTQLDLILGSVGVRRTEPDYEALNLGDLILGRLGLYGRLGARMRDQQGLAYYVTSGIEAGIGPGPWTVRAGVNPQNPSRAVESIITELRCLCTEPVTREELDDACDFLTGSLALRLETNDGIAAMLSDIELYRLGLDYLQRYPAMLRAITAEQILAAAQKHALQENYVLSIAGPTAQGG